MLIDITKPLSPHTEVYPNDPVFNMEKIFSIENDGFNLHRLSMGSHTGSHMDSPLHFLKNGADICSFPKELFITQAKIIDVSSVDEISASFLKTHDLDNIKSLIFKTKGKKVYLTCGGAEYIASKNISITGTELMDIEDETDYGFKVHKILLSNNIFILENLLLKDVSQGVYTLYCFPLKIECCDASPVRAVIKE